jgi:hypothetical protein
MTRHEAIMRIADEYDEMPGLKLTASQARRLWNMPGDECTAALGVLVARGFLVQTRTGTFVRSCFAAPPAP